MSTSPNDAMLLGVGFIIVGVLVGYGGLKMGSGQVMLLLGAGAMVGGASPAMTGLVRWLWGRLRR